MSVSIMVRSRVRSHNNHEEGSPKYYTEWAETVHSWKAVWSIVTDCCAKLSEYRQWQLGEDSHHWFLDIGGVDELAALHAWFEAFMKRMGGRADG